MLWKEKEKKILTVMVKTLKENVKKENMNHESCNHDSFYAIDRNFMF